MRRRDAVAHNKLLHDPSFDVFLLRGSFRRHALLFFPLPDGGSRCVVAPIAPLLGSALTSGSAGVPSAYLLTIADLR